MDTAALSQLCFETLLDLASENGIHASARTEAYGCVFGRDSAITVLKMLRTAQKKHDDELIKICRTALQALISLQGKEVNLESGEEPGKCIHEYRPDKYDHLVNRDKPWYVYPDKKLKNYDSVDSTPLLLIAIHRLWEVTKDTEFLLKSLDAVEAGLNWIMNYGDKDGDHLIEYTLHPDRKHGGLNVQSWTDSMDCLQRPDGTFPNYPIAAVEVQAMAWLALKQWGDFYFNQNPEFSKKLNDFADKMKTVFNKSFVYEENGSHYLAQALDGDKNQIRTVTPNPLVCLWASYIKDGYIESIVDAQYVDDLVKRVFATDMFDETAGLRTMSSLSPTFKPLADSYHNGSFWPMLNGLVYEGLQHWGYDKEAEMLKQATLHAVTHFNCPIELYIKTPEGEFVEYTSPRGKKGCRYQAWTAAAVLEMVT